MSKYQRKRSRLNGGKNAAKFHVPYRNGWTFYDFDDKTAWRDFRRDMRDEEKRNDAGFSPVVVTQDGSMRIDGFVEVHDFDGRWNTLDARKVIRKDGRVHLFIRDEYAYGNVVEVDPRRFKFSRSRLYMPGWRTGNHHRDVFDGHREEVRRKREEEERRRELEELDRKIAEGRRLHDVDMAFYCIARRSGKNRSKSQLAALGIIA